MCDQSSSLESPPSSEAPPPSDGLVLSDSDPEDDPSRLPLSTEVRELSSSSEEEEVGARPSPGGPRGAFILRGAGSGFTHRSRSIFDCLDGVAKATEAATEAAPGEHALFAKPLPPPPLPPGRPGGGERGGGGRGGVPDYLLHPERWTRYSLEDTPLCSERENRAVAHGYLQGLTQGRGGPVPPQDPPDLPCLPQKVVFSRPAPPTRPPGGRGQDHSSPPGGGELRKYLSHLQEGEGGEEGADHGSPGDGKRKRKMEQRGGALVEEEEEEEEEEEGGPPAFVSFKKANRKNYRKTSQQDDG